MQNKKQTYLLVGIPVGFILLIGLIFLFTSSEFLPSPEVNENNMPKDCVNLGFTLEPTKVPIKLYVEKSTSFENFNNNFSDISIYLKQTTESLSSQTSEKKFAPLDINDFVKTIEKNPENDLKVIITDFNNIQSSFANYLIKNYLDKDASQKLSVGFLKLGNFNKNFYILILGKYDNIYQFYMRLKLKAQDKNDMSIQNKNFIIFSSSVIFRTILFRDLNFANTQGNEQIFTLDLKDDKNEVIYENAGLLLENPSDLVKEYEIFSTSNLINIETTFSFHKFYYTPDFKVLKPQVTIEYWDSSNKKFIKDDNLKKNISILGYEINRDSKTSVDIFGDKMFSKPNIIGVIRKNSLAKFRTFIDISKFTSNLKYRINISLYPSSNYDLENPLISSVSTYSLVNPDLKKGNYNTTVFVEKMLESMNISKNNEHIKVADFIYYIKK